MLYFKERFVHFHRQTTKIILYLLKELPLDKKTELYYFMILIIIPITDIVLFV